MAEDPVTVTIARRVAPGREPEFEEWADRLTEIASEFPGFLGCGRLKPGGDEAVTQDWHVVYRFASQDALAVWEESAERNALLDEGAELMQTVGMQKVSGLETWFSLPGMVTKPPPKWKMFLVSGVVIWLLQTLEYVVFGRFVTHWPIPVRVLFMSFPVTAIMTWLVMPRASVLLRRWLYGAD
ncbi:antibiotic biosynthesis monooxygenase [Ammonicoccus fulvus]|uniref:Antibiotic biosynthesis monooxygenase n=1 Tax=Ammonicoccus fulvus TaxID=3138240 RepID=A0ABZ3FVJ4_9ACTN